MTLIASFYVNKSPIVFGDLLIVGESSASRSMMLPSQGDVTDIFGPDWKVMGLNQKLNLIGPNFLIAWSGKGIGARLTIGELKRRYDNGGLTGEEILSYLASEPELKLHPAVFIGLLIRGDVLTRFEHGAEKFESPRLGRVHVAGTGTATMREFAKVLEAQRIDATGPMGESDVAMFQALSLGGMLLQSELIGGYRAHSLLHMFGGGYEIAHLTESGIAKLDDLTYVMWDAAVYSDGRAVVTHPQFLFKQKYLGDYLLIRSARLRDLAVVDQQRRVVYPMFTPSYRPSVDAIRSVTLQSPRLCHCIAVRHYSLLPFFVTILEPHAEAGGSGLNIREQDGQLSIYVTADLKRRIEEAIREGVTWNATPAP